MIYKVYSIFDVAVGVYSRPFFMRSKGEALRAFTDLANDNQSTISRYPSSHTLFEIGEYDDNSGIFTGYPAFTALGNAVEFKNPVDSVKAESFVV